MFEKDDSQDKAKKIPNLAPIVDLKNEGKYRSLFKSVNEGFCIIQMIFDDNDHPVDYRFLEINSAFKAQTGLKDAKGKTMRMLHPEHEEYWFEIYGKVALTGEPVRFERPAEALGRFFDVYAFPIGDPESRKVAVLFKNITSRKEKEYANRWFGAIIDGSNDAIISKNLDGIITSWNSGAEQLFGYSAREAVGQNITIIIPKDRLDEEKKILSWLKQGRKIDRLETVRKKKNGTMIPVSLTVSPVRDFSGKIIGASKIAHDITKRKRAEEKLKEMNETLEEKVEQRTAELRAYQRQLRLLTSRLNQSEEDQRDWLATELHSNLGQILALTNIKVNSLKSLDLSQDTKEEVDELSELVQNALSYTRELMSDLKPPPFLNKEDFGEVLDWLVQKMKKYGLQVNIEDDGQPKPLNADVRNTLQQSVQELLFNVIKHAGVKKADIQLTRLENAIKITVEDEGEGFEMNRKQPEQTQEGGFGLFNMYERMDFLGGNFEVKSKPGEGTKAVLIAPLTDHKAFDDKESDKTDGPSQSTDVVRTSPTNPVPFIKILLVDDHEMVRSGFRKMIEGKDEMMIISEASSGEEALKLVFEDKPDVIVMDVDMPGMDGIETTRKISLKHPDIQIIGLSLHHKKELERNMKKAGASAYLTKEKGFEMLYATIKNVVKK